MRTMYDSTTAADIPTNAQMVAGYANGVYKWSAADWARFPNAVRVTIAVSVDADANVLDVENGDALPTQAPGWVQRQRAAMREGSVYCNRSNVDALRTAFANAGVVLPPLWLAHYDGIAEIPEGFIAKQYEDPSLSGGHYDLSVVADYWLGVDDMTPEQVQAAIDASLAAYGARLQVELDANYAKVADLQTLTARVNKLDQV